ncbi:MAG: hypothetical protein KIT72_18750 [Polyangiaceae bacterium]|nr:hypothetical protein [Polyangiaceae bacterium]MCW5792459.1 hypothetical protein [Polyangiaceae bacterium]
MAKPSRAGLRWPEIAKRQPPSELQLADAYEIGKVAAERFPSTPMPEILKSEGLSLTRVTLRRCLAVYRVLRDLGEDPGSTCLNFATARQLDGLPRKHQRALLEEVERGLAAKRLELRIRALRAGLPRPSNNARRLLGFELAMRRLGPFERGDYALEADWDLAEQLDGATRRELRERAGRVAARLERVHRVLQGGRRGARGGDAED